MSTDLLAEIARRRAAAEAAERERSAQVPQNLQPPTNGHTPGSAGLSRAAILRGLLGDEPAVPVNRQAFPDSSPPPQPDQRNIIGLIGPQPQAPQELAAPAVRPTTNGRGQSPITNGVAGGPMAPYEQAATRGEFIQPPGGLPEPPGTLPRGPTRRENIRERVAAASAEMEARSFAGFGDLPEDAQRAVLNARRHAYGLSPVPSVPGRVTAADVAGEVTGSLRGAASMVPFVGGIAEGVDWYRISQAAEAAEAGTATDDQMETLTDFWERMAVESRDTTFGGKVATILRHSLPFMAEFLVTGGAAPAARKAGQKVARRAAINSLGKATRSVLRNLPKDIAGMARRTARQTPFFTHRIAAETIREQIPDFELRPGEEDQVDFLVHERGDDFWLALAKGTASTAIELFSERTGETLGAFGTLAGRAAQKTPLRIPIEKAGQIKAALAARLMKDRGWNLAQVREFLESAGYHGWIAEIGEERVADILRYAVRLDEELHIPTGEELGAEAVAFAIPGLTGAVAARAMPSGGPRGGTPVDQAPPEGPPPGSLAAEAGSNPLPLAPDYVLEDGPAAETGESRPPGPGPDSPLSSPPSTLSAEPQAEPRPAAGAREIVGGQVEVAPRAGSTGNLVDVVHRPSGAVVFQAMRPDVANLITAEINEGSLIPGETSRFTVRGTSGRWEVVRREDGRVVASADGLLMALQQARNENAGTEAQRDEGTEGQPPPRPAIGPIEREHAEQMLGAWRAALSNYQQRLTTAVDRHERTAIEQDIARTQNLIGQQEQALAGRPVAVDTALPVAERPVVNVERGPKGEPGYVIKRLNNGAHLVTFRGNVPADVLRRLGDHGRTFNEKMGGYLFPAAYREPQITAVIRGTAAGRPEPRREEKGERRKEKEAPDRSTFSSPPSTISAQPATLPAKAAAGEKRLGPEAMTELLAIQGDRQTVIEGLRARGFDVAVIKDEVLARHPSNEYRYRITRNSVERETPRKSGWHTRKKRKLADFAEFARKQLRADLETALRDMVNRHGVLAGYLERGTGEKGIALTESERAAMTAKVAEIERAYADLVPKVRRASVRIPIPEMGQKTGKSPKVQKSKPKEKPDGVRDEKGEEVREGRAAEQAPTQEARETGSAAAPAGKVKGRKEKGDAAAEQKAEPPATPKKPPKPKPAAEPPRPVTAPAPSKKAAEARKPTSNIEAMAAEGRKDLERQETERKKAQADAPPPAGETRLVSNLTVTVKGRKRTLRRALLRPVPGGTEIRDAATGDIVLKRSRNPLLDVKTTVPDLVVMRREQRRFKALHRELKTLVPDIRNSSHATAINHLDMYEQAIMPAAREGQIAAIDFSPRSESTYVAPAVAGVDLSDANRGPKGAYKGWTRLAHHGKAEHQEAFVGTQAVWDQQQGDGPGERTFRRWQHEIRFPKPPPTAETVADGLSERAVTEIKRRAGLPRAVGKQLRPAFRHRESGKVFEAAEHEFDQLPEKFRITPDVVDPALEVGYLDKVGKWVPINEALDAVAREADLWELGGELGLPRGAVQRMLDNQDMGMAFGRTLTTADDLLRAKQALAKAPDSPSLKREHDQAEAAWKEARDAFMATKVASDFDFFPREATVTPGLLIKLRAFSLRLAHEQVRQLVADGKLTMPTVSETMQPLTADEMAYLRSVKTDTPHFGMGAAFNMPESRGWWRRLVDSIVARLLNAEPGTGKANVVMRAGQLLYGYAGWISHDLNIPTATRQRISRGFDQVKGAQRQQEFRARELVRSIDAGVRKEAKRVTAETDAQMAEVQAKYHRAIEDVLRGDKGVDTLAAEPRRIYDGYVKHIQELTDEILTNPWMWEHLAAFGLQNVHQVIAIKRMGAGAYLKRLYKRPQEAEGFDPFRPKFYRLGPRLQGGMFRERRGNEEWITLVDSTGEKPLMWQFQNEEQAREAFDQRLAEAIPKFGESAFQKIRLMDPFDVEAAEAAGVLVPERDLRLLMTRSLVDQATNLAALKLFKLTRDTAAIDVAQPGYVQLDNNPQLGPLAGMWVPASIGHALMEAETLRRGVMSKLYDVWLYAWKFSKVPVSPSTWGRQVQGAITFGALDGFALNPVTATRALRQAKKEFKTKGPLYQRLLGENVITTGWHAAEARDLERFIEEHPWPASIMKWAETHPRAIKALHKGYHTTAEAADTIGRGYDYVDQLFKMASYIDKTQRLGWSHEEAIHHVQNMYPNYDKIGVAARWLRRSPIGAPFIAFTGESIKIYLHAARNHPARLAVLLGSAGALTMMSRLILGVDDDEMALINQDPTRRRNFVDAYFQPLLPWRGKNGRPAMLDLRWTMPLAGDFRVTQSGGGMKVPFLFENPASSVVLEGMFNRHLWNDRPLFNERDYDPEDRFITGKRMAKWLLWATSEMAPIPPLLPEVELVNDELSLKGGAQRIYESAMGLRHVSLPSALAKELFGVNIREPWARRQDVYDLLKRRLGQDRADSFARILREYNEVYRGHYDRPIYPSNVARSLREEAGSSDLARQGRRAVR